MVESQYLHAIYIMKLALFCTPYYLRHGIEIFIDYSLLLDVTALVWKLKKCKVIFLSLTFKREVHSSSEMLVTAKWTNQVLFCLAYCNMYSVYLFT